MNAIEIEQDRTKINEASACFNNNQAAVSLSCRTRAARFPTSGYRIAKSS